MQNLKIFLPAAVAAVFAIPLYGGVPADMQSLGRALADMGDYSGDCRYEVLLPTSRRPVVYEIGLFSRAAAGDTLAPADYVIDWAVAKDGNSSRGFSAYADGNHYRFRGDRLQEYHYTDDPVPFAPRGTVDGGVQNNAQFTDLLPQYIGRKLIDMAADSSYRCDYLPDKTVNGRRCIVVDGVRTFGGVDALEFVYAFDRETLMPVSADFEANPGQIGEQTITAAYSYPATRIRPYEAITEDALMAVYADAFGNCRESDFRLDNMPGRKLPEFTAPTVTGERYTRHKDDGFAVPTVIAVLDSEIGSAGATVEALRRAADAMPMQTDIIFAFVSNDIDAIEALTGAAREGEHILMSARRLARDCGVTATPVIIICDRDAVVKEIINGYNNDLTDVVIQKTVTSAGK